MYIYYTYNNGYFSRVLALYNYTTCGEELYPPRQLFNAITFNAEQFSEATLTREQITPVSNSIIMNISIRIHRMCIHSVITYPKLIATYATSFIQAKKTLAIFLNTHGNMKLIARHESKYKLLTFYTFSIVITREA